MKIELKNCVNHGEFLQTFADVTLDDGKVKRVSYCHKSLPFTVDGVFNALVAQALAPPYVEPKPDPGKPIETKPVDSKPRAPDTARIARVTTLKNAYEALSTKQKIITTAPVEKAEVLK